jgi:phosphate transport system substrate-binding protein
MKSLYTSLMAFVLTLATTFIPAHAADDLTGKLAITGSSTVAPLISEIAKRFEQKHSGVRIDVQTGGSSRGITDATRGTADIGMSSRALKESEAKEVVSHTIARDGIGMLVHASNPVKNLDDAQILKIYKGEIKNWRDVGGNDAAITVINRADGRAELEQFIEYFKIKAPDITASLVSGENQHGIKTVAGDPNALIYMSIGASEQAAANGETVKLLTWNGIEASKATVSNGKLPVNRPLILVTKPDMSPLAKAFVAFATSADVHDLVTGLSYVPVQ